MGITNLTGHEKHKSLKELYCSSELTGDINTQLLCLSVLNIFLSITAFLGNTLILAAFLKESSLHPLSKLLLRNLAITDLCVGIIVQPLGVTYYMSVKDELWNICRVACITAHATGYSLGSVSLLTLTAISVDRLLALLLGLRYRQVVTLKRTCLTVAVIWAISVVSTTMNFYNYLITVWYATLGTSVCLVISIFCYAKIFLTLRHRQVQVEDPVHQEQLTQTIPQNRVRYRRTVSIALWVQLMLVVCYLPRGVIEALVIQRGMSSSIYLPKTFAVTLVSLNSSINPILYCWKIREVRQAVKDIVRELCSSSR